MVSIYLCRIITHSEIVDHVWHLRCRRLQTYITVGVGGVYKCVVVALCHDCMLQQAFVSEIFIE